MRTLLQEVIKSGHHERHEELKFVAETLIVCNQPDRFENLIKVLDPKLRCICGYYEGNSNYIYNCFACNCNQTCKILHRQECEHVLDSYISETLKRLNEEQKGLNETTKIDLKYSRDKVEGPLRKYSRDKVERPLLKYSQDEVEGPHTCDFKDNNVFIGVKKRSLLHLLHLLHDHPFSKNAIQEALELIPNISHDINLTSANGLPPL